MKILLLGDYSNVHATLAEGLRALGHSVVVASDGDGWKDYPRDIDLKRPGTPGAGTLRQRILDMIYLVRLRWLFTVKFRGFDVVQIINPVFLPIRAERIMPYYRQLRRNNAQIFMAAYGMDYYWVKAGRDCRTFRYSDFNIGPDIRQDIPENEIFVAEWLKGEKGRLNQAIAADCDGIPAGLYEYWASYRAYLPSEHQYKLQYIPFPIEISSNDDWPAFDRLERKSNAPVRFFIGIQRRRNAYKGTDIMLRALERLKVQFPQLVEIRKVENVPFAEYRRLMQSSDVILDQLYSYTPAMNALEAMSQGLVVVGGAEPEYYDLQECASSLSASEQNANNGQIRPIINVAPTEESVYAALCDIVEHRSELQRLKRESVEFVRRYHNHVAVARQYLSFWRSMGA